jgi:hypothetical protein
MLEPRRLTTLWASTACRRNSYIFLPFIRKCEKIKHPCLISTICWDMTSCSPVEVHLYFGGTCCLQLWGQSVSFLVFLTYAEMLLYSTRLHVSHHKRWHFDLILFLVVRWLLNLCKTHSALFLYRKQTGVNGLITFSNRQRSSLILCPTISETSHQQVH